MKLLLVLWWVAQPAPPAQTPDDAALAEAKQHYERGKELFKSGAYDQAILEFKAADQIKPSPILAYNIGLAYEKLGRCKAAIGFFNRYLREQPDADNRADTEQKIADQNAKFSRGECAGQQQRQNQPPPGPGTGTEPPPPPTGGEPIQQQPMPQPFPQPMPPPVDTSPVRSENGLHSTAFGLRFGPIFGGIGSHITHTSTADMAIELESTTGIALRPSAQFPMITLPDGRTIVQGEIFGVFARYGGSGKFQVNATMSPLNATAILAGAGFAARGNIYVSPKLPLAITPALGIGAAGQLFHVTTDDGMCDISASVPSVLVNVDLAARFELAAHHAFYFSPVNLYIITPALGGDDQDVDLGCIMAGNHATIKNAFGTGDTQVNYNIDFGYMFQF